LSRLPQSVFIFFIQTLPDGRSLPERNCFSPERGKHRYFLADLRRHTLPLRLRSKGTRGSRSRSSWFWSPMSSMQAHLPFQVMTYALFFFLPGLSDPRQFNALPSFSAPLPFSENDKKTFSPIRRSRRFLPRNLDLFSPIFLMRAKHSWPPRLSVVF